MPPMDTLMTDNGLANSFHIQHYGARAFGGVGTIIVESTAVSEEGKIRPQDLGIWNHEQVEAFKKVVSICKIGGSIIGLQLNHAGSKAEHVKNRIGATTKRKYMNTISGSIKLASDEDLNIIKYSFIKAAKNAKDAGFDFIEIHAAHGYLLSTILHPALNEISDEISIIKRGELIIDIIKEIRQEIKIPIGIRISSSDGQLKGQRPEDFAPLLREIDKYITYVHSSLGSIFEKELFDYSKGKLIGLPFALEIKKLTSNSVIVVKNYQTREDVDFSIKKGIDAISIGQEILYNPNLVINKLLMFEEIDDKKYHWNNNPWWSPKTYAIKKVKTNKI